VGKTFHPLGLSSPLPPTGLLCEKSRKEEGEIPPLFASLSYGRPGLVFLVLFWEGRRKGGRAGQAAGKGGNRVSRDPHNLTCVFRSRSFSFFVLHMYRVCGCGGGEDDAGKNKKETRELQVFLGLCYEEVCEAAVAFGFCLFT